MILEEFPEVLDDELRCAGLAVLHEPLVDPNDVHQFVGEVVLGALAVVERDGGSCGHRRHREHSQDHPLGSRALGVDAEDADVLVRDVLEPIADIRGHQLVEVLLGEIHRKRTLDGLPAVLARAELATQDLVDPRELDIRLVGELLGRGGGSVLVLVGLHRRRDHLGIVGGEDVLNLVVGRGFLVLDVVLLLAAVGTAVLLSGLTDRGLRDVVDVVVEFAGALEAGRELLALGRVEQEARTLPTGPAKESSDEFREADVDHGGGEFDVAEVAVARTRVLPARTALEAGIDDT